MTHSDKNDNPCLKDEISWDEADLQRVLAEHTVNRDEVLKSLRQIDIPGRGTRWVIEGGIETLKRLNLTEWVDLVEAMHSCVSEISEEELERYQYKPD
jgi:hypothetical protein